MVVWSCENGQAGSDKVVRQKVENSNRARVDYSHTCARRIDLLVKVVECQFVSSA